MTVIVSITTVTGMFRGWFQRTLLRVGKKKEERKGEKNEKWDFWH